MTDSGCNNKKTILLVEDEPLVLKMVTKMLERIGYAVVAEHSPREAINLVQKDNRAISFVLSDVLMPEINGVELIKQLLLLNPGLKVMLMSGYSADIIARQHLRGMNIPFIEKPFSEKQLAVKLRKAWGDSQ